MGLFDRLTRDRKGKRQRVEHVQPRLPPRPVQARSYSPEPLSDSSATYTTINSQIAYRLDQMRGDARTAYHRNEYIRKGVRTIQNSVVGDGVVLRPNTGSKNVDSALVAAWKMWQRDCSLDGRLTFRQAQRIAVQTFYTDGDSFTLKHPDTATGLKIQMIDSIFVPSFFWILGEGNPVVMGVEINRNTAKPEGYWARKEIDHNTRHLSAWQVLGFDQQAQVNRRSMTRYPADMVVHAYDQEYPAQYRGAPALSTPLKRLVNISGFETDVLEAARIAALAAMFAVPDASNTAGSRADDEATIDFKAGSMNVMSEGWALDSFRPEQPATTYKDFVVSQLEAVASGAEVPYSDLSGDYSRANFSSLRAASMSQRDVIRHWQSVLIEKFVRPIFEAWLLSGNLDPSMVAAVDLSRIEFVGKMMPHVQPREEATANQIAIETKVKSRSQIIREMGGDPETVFEELEMEAERFSQNVPMLNTAIEGDEDGDDKTETKTDHNS